jgi:hypothetical protein
VTVVVDATRRELIIEYRLQPIKRIAIKGLYHDIMSFETYLEAMREEARLDWCRVFHHSRQVTM